MLQKAMTSGRALPCQGKSEGFEAPLLLIMYQAADAAKWHAQVLVNEPSVLDTIQILRGIAEKYASFHGVRISDRALVAAAELSTRYIQGRFRESPHPCSAYSS